MMKWRVHPMLSTRLRKTQMVFVRNVLLPLTLLGSPRILRCLVVALGVWMAEPRAMWGQADGEAGADLRTARLQQMHDVIERVEALSGPSGTRKPMERVPQPILRFSDVARDHEDGTLWIWGRTGRPIAILELYRNFGADAWVMTMSSLSTGQFRLQGRSGWAWESESPGLAFQSFASAPAPAAKRASRLRQMKQLAMRLSAHQFWDPNNQRSELRLLPRPVHRYQDAAAGLLDGALFLFCHSTNPELIVILEAVQHERAAPTWQYALARLGHAEFHAAMDGREVWKVPRVKLLSPRDPYYQVFEPAKDHERR
jgi:hypothetical protein